MCAERHATSIKSTFINKNANKWGQNSYIPEMSQFNQTFPFNSNHFMILWNMNWCSLLLKYLQLCRFQCITTFAKCKQIFDTNHCTVSQWSSLLHLAKRPYSEIPNFITREFLLLLLFWFGLFVIFVFVCLFVLVGVELYQQNSRKLQIMQSDVILLISWATCQIKHRLFFLKNLYTSFWLTFKCSFLSFWGISMFCLRTSQKFNKAPGGSPLLL